MARLTRLMVVNACLKSMGETPLNSLDADHPYVQAALNTLSETNTLEQSVGWWFNTDYVRLTNDPGTGFVYVPADAINVEFDDTLFVQRGKRVWNSIDSTYDIGRVVHAKVIREIPFTDLPTNVQQMVSMRTQLDFQSAFDADDAKYKKLYQAYTQAYSRVRRMHINNQRINMLHSPHAQRVLSGIQPGGRRPLYPNRIR